MQLMDFTIYLGNIYWVPLHARHFAGDWDLQWLIGYIYTLKTISWDQKLKIYLSCK